MPNAKKHIYSKFFDIQETDVSIVKTYFCKLCKELYDNGRISQISSIQNRMHRPVTKSFKATRLNQHCRTVHDDNLAVVEVYNLRPLNTSERQRNFRRRIDSDHPVIVKVDFPQNEVTKREFIKSFVRFICQSGSSFSIVANTYFRAMFTSWADNVPAPTRNEIAQGELAAVYSKTSHNA